VLERSIFSEEDMCGRSST